MPGWLIIGVTHIAFRRRKKDKLHYPGFPFTTLAALAILVAALIASLILPALYLAVYFTLHHNRA